MQAEVAARLELESDLREAIEQRAPDARLPADRRPSGWPHRRRRGARSLVPSAARRRTPFGLHPERRGERPHRSRLAPGSFDGRASTSPTCGVRGGAAADLRLSVNLSPGQLRDRSIVDEVLGALREAGLPHDALGIEITESLVLDVRRGGTRVSPRASRRRVRGLVRRLRDRLLVARQPSIPAHRRAEDRHLVRCGDARWRSRRGGRRGRHSPRCGAGRGGRRRGRRGRGHRRTAAWSWAARSARATTSADPSRWPRSSRASGIWPRRPEG